MVEEAFLPTLHTFMRAPIDSPLSAVKLSVIGDFFASTTYPVVRHTQCTHLHLTAAQDDDGKAVLDNAVHVSVLIKLCNEIVSEAESDNIKPLCKASNKLI